MATPRIFISSTCYDLKYMRENMGYFIKNLGYDPVLSEAGSVYFDPTLSTQDACLYEVPNCQLFVLLIGGRFGEPYKDTKASITNVEYREAVKCKIPIFALVEHSVHAEYFVYRENKANPDIDESKVRYPSVDSVRIFDFIEEVRENSVNNALVPFRDFADIESYLKKQWAGMMFSFLTKQNEERRVSDTLSEVTSMSDKIEFLSTQILRSIGTEEAKVTAELYDLMLTYECVRDLAFIGLKPTPRDILVSETFELCAKALGKHIEVEETNEYSISGGGWMSRPRFALDSKEYDKLRERMIEVLSEHDISLDTFLKD